MTEETFHESIVNDSILIVHNPVHTKLVNRIDSLLSGGKISLEMWQAMKILADSTLHVDTQKLAEEYMNATDVAVKEVLRDLAEVTFIDQILDLSVDASHSVEVGDIDISDTDNEELSAHSGADSGSYTVEEDPTLFPESWAYVDDPKSANEESTSSEEVQ